MTTDITQNYVTMPGYVAVPPGNLVNTKPADAGSTLYDHPHDRKFQVSTDLWDTPLAIQHRD